MTSRISSFRNFHLIKTVLVLILSFPSHCVSPVIGQFQMPGALANSKNLLGMTEKIWSECADASRRNKMLSTADIFNIDYVLNSFAKAVDKIPSNLTKAIFKVVNCLFNDNFQLLNVPKVREFHDRMFYHGMILSIIENTQELKNRFIKFSASQFGIFVQDIPFDKIPNILVYTGYFRGISNRTVIDIVKTTTTTSMHHAFAQIIFPTSGIIKSLIQSNPANFTRVAVLIYESNIFHENMSQWHFDFMRSSQHISERERMTAGRLTSWIAELHLVGVPSTSDVPTKVETRFRDVVGASTTGLMCLMWVSGLDSTQKKWTHTGCRKLQSDSDNVTSCSCNRTGIYALVSIRKERVMGIFTDFGKTIKDWSIVLGSSAALFTTSVSLLVFIAFAKRLCQDVTLIVMFNYTFFVLLTNVCLVLALKHQLTFNLVACRVVAVILHVSLLSVFAWALVDVIVLLIQTVVAPDYWNLSNFSLWKRLGFWLTPPAAVIIFAAVLSVCGVYAYENYGMCASDGPNIELTLLTPFFAIVSIQSVALIFVAISIKRQHRSFEHRGNRMTSPSFRLLIRPCVILFINLVVQSVTVYAVVERSSVSSIVMCVCLILHGSIILLVTLQLVQLINLSEFNFKCKRRSVAAVVKEESEVPTDEALAAEINQPSAFVGMRSRQISRTISSEVIRTLLANIGHAEKESRKEKGHSSGGKTEETSSINSKTEKKKSASTLTSLQNK